MVFILAVSCQSANQRNLRNTGNVDDAKDAIDANRNLQVDEAKKHVYATGVALGSETNRTGSVILATEMNEMAKLTLGNPDIADVNELTGMVTGLLSTNSTEVVKAEQIKARLIKRIASLQSDVSELKDDLSEAEAKRDADYRKAAEKAERWETWTRRVKWIAGGLGFLIFLTIALPAASIAFPAIAPVAGLFSSLVGNIVKSIFRLIPSAVGKAGVVAGNTFNGYQQALKALTAAIDEMKLSNRTVYEAELRPKLLDKTDENTTRNVIRDVRANATPKITL